MPGKRKRTMGSKHWCFTINNYTEADTPNENLFTYIVIGREVGEDGTPHLQGYCVFKTRKRLSGAKKVFPRAHLEIKKGTAKQASDYCKKNGDFMEDGVLPLSNAQRQQKKWDDAKAAALLGDFDAIPTDMLVRYYHNWKRLRQDNPVKPKDLHHFHNYWIHADTQYGKSNYARTRWPNYFDKNPTKWFTGYQGQKTILLDDFGPEQMRYLSWYLKRWADLYSFPMETKGGGRQIRPRNIIVTSQYTIFECFPNDPKLCAAVSNRFKVIELEHWHNRVHTSKTK